MCCKTIMLCKRIKVHITEGCLPIRNNVDLPYQIAELLFPKMGNNPVQLFLFVIHVFFKNAVKGRK